MSDPTPGRSNRRNLLFALAAGLVGLLLVGGIAVLASGRGGGAAGVGEGSYRGSEPPVRMVLPSFELPSYRGGLVATRELHGQVVLLTLLDSQCTEACPILAFEAARAIDQLTADERAQVRALAITGDPAEDTPASVRRFLAARRAQAGSTTCSGPSASCAHSGGR